MITFYVFDDEEKRIHKSKKISDLFTFPKTDTHSTVTQTRTHTHTHTHTHTQTHTHMHTHIQTQIYAQDRQSNKHTKIGIHWKWWINFYALADIHLRTVIWRHMNRTYSHNDIHQETHAYILANINRDTQIQTLSYIHKHRHIHTYIQSTFSYTHTHTYMYIYI